MRQAVQVEQHQFQAGVRAEPEYHTDLPVGEILRRTRVHYGLSLSDIEHALRIRESLIHAIETGDESALPGRVYAIGFVRTYAEYLGFDGNQITKLFKKQSTSTVPEADINFSAETSENQIPSPWIIAASITVFVLFVWGWSGFSKQDRALVEDIPAIEEGITEETAFTPPDLRNVASPASINPVSENKNVKNVPVSTEQQGILLEIVENSWVEITDKSGNPLVSRVLKAGEKYFVPHRPDLSLSIGNAGGIQFSIDGQKIPYLGKRGDILKDISLNGDNLKNLSVSPAP